jgi:CarboxypepD_reg-like domain/TonB-dependent Receptor Plug Domain
MLFRKTQRLILLFLLIFISVTVFSAPIEESNRGTIKGTILDRSTREPIPAASILLIGFQRGAAADLDGKFEISNLEYGIYHIQVQALGYEPQVMSEITVTPSRIPNLEFMLVPTTLTAEEITFTVQKFEIPSPDLPTSTRNMRHEEIRRAPGAAEDIQRMVQSLPGVVNQNDQSNEIVVRGGSPTENLTIIDGIEIDNINHFVAGEEGSGGAISGLNTEFLSDVTFAAGGFSAKYGDRMSSVLDLNLREGDRDGFGGSADFGMAGIGGHVEGPIAGGRGSYMTSLHRSYLEVMPEDAVGLATVPVYWNAQTKIVYDLSEKHLLTINGIYLEDSQTVEASDQDEDDEENGLAAGIDAFDFNASKYLFGARLRSLWGNGFSDIVVAHTYSHNYSNQYDVEEINGVENKRATYKGRRDDYKNQLHLTYTGKARVRDEWSAGLSLKPFTYEQNLWVGGDSILFNDGYLGDGLNGMPDTFYYEDDVKKAKKSALLYGSFFQYSWKPNRDLIVTAGLRHDGFDYSKVNVIDPRLSMNWSFQPRWTFSAAWGIYHQSHDIRHYIDDYGIGINKGLDHGRAVQYVAGFSFIPHSSSFLSVEGYYKDYDNLLVSKQDIERETQNDRTIQSDLIFAERTQTSWGIEFFAQQKLMKNWFSTLSYSYSETESEDLAFGKYPSTYDMTHAITAVLGYKTTLMKYDGYRNALKKPWMYWLHILPINGDELTFSSRFRYLTGRPYTDQEWYTIGADSPDPIYEGHWEDSDYHAERYPDYMRWDFRIDNKYYYGRSALVLYIEIENVLNRENVAEYFYDDDGDKNELYQFRQMFLLGLRYEF